MAIGKSVPTLCLEFAFIRTCRLLGLPRCHRWNSRIVSSEVFYKLSYDSHVHSSLQYSSDKTQYCTVFLME